jgi:hypothetical protein
MRKTHACGALIALICCSLTVSAQGQRYLRAIEVFSSGVPGGSADKPVAPKRFVALDKRKIAAELELGEGIEGYDVVLRPRPGVAAEFKVEQRIETSMTIQNEGPHLDLIDWKHYYSPWVPLDELGANRYRVREVSEQDKTSFPAAGPEEIRAAVRSAGGEEWARLVKNVRRPGDAPAAVGVSKISLRVSVRDGSGWRVISLIEFSVPMGC